MKILCLLFIIFLTITNVAVGNSLKKIIKKSAYMDCENKSFFGSKFHDDEIVILTYKNYLLFVNHKQII